jgi:hypothetical protein
VVNRFETKELPVSKSVFCISKDDAHRSEDTEKTLFVTGHLIMLSKRLWNRNTKDVL